MFLCGTVLMFGFQHPLHDITESAAIAQGIITLHSGSLGNIGVSLRVQTNSLNSTEAATGERQ